MLEVIYLIFNEGYSATAGDDWMRPALCEDALRLGRILAELAPAEPEVHGLVALMEIQASRAAARDRVQPASRSCCSSRIAHGGISCSFVAALRRSNEPGVWADRAGRTCCRRRLPRVMPGRASPADTDWAAIVALYGELGAVDAVAGRRAESRGGGVDGIRAGGGAAARRCASSLQPALKNYHLLPSVRGDLLVKLGRFDEARPEFERAASLTRNARERELLLGRAREAARAVSNQDKGPP